MFGSSNKLGVDSVNQKRIKSASKAHQNSPDALKKWIKKRIKNAPRRLDRADSSVLNRAY